MESAKPVLDWAMLPGGIITTVVAGYFAIAAARQNLQPKKPISFAENTQLKQRIKVKHKLTRITYRNNPIVFIIGVFLILLFGFYLIFYLLRAIELWPVNIGSSLLAVFYTFASAILVWNWSRNLTNSTPQLESYAEIVIEASREAVNTACIKAIASLNARLITFDSFDNPLEAITDTKWLSSGRKFRIEIQEIKEGHSTLDCHLLKVTSTSLRDSSEKDRLNGSPEDASNVSNFVQKFIELSASASEESKPTSAMTHKREVFPAMNAPKIQPVSGRSNVPPGLPETEEQDEPYDWGGVDPRTLGRPVYFDPRLGGLVVEEE